MVPVVAGPARRRRVYRRTDLASTPGDLSTHDSGNDSLYQNQAADERPARREQPGSSPVHFDHGDEDESDKAVRAFQGSPGRLKSARRSTSDRIYRRKRRDRQTRRKRHPARRSAASGEEIVIDRHYCQRNPSRRR